jgi:hypothetical protein
VSAAEIGALIVGLLLLAAAAAAPAVYASWRRVVGNASDLQIWEMLRRHGVSREAAKGSERDLVAAAHRCTACPSIAQCDAELASRHTPALEEFCPNARLVQRLKN